MLSSVSYYFRGQKPAGKDNRPLSAFVIDGSTNVPARIIMITVIFLRVFLRDVPHFTTTLQYHFSYALNLHRKTYVMAVLNGSAEREPLLERSTSPSLSDSEGKDGEAVISTLRGSLVVGSVGLLIFLQGMSSYLFESHQRVFFTLIMYCSIHL